ncbi:MAG: OsmC family peroxiredoxin [Corynebacterium sp.]|uniref:OsmC family peroxiredoxin n=1 Tax=Corynebacterium TaxID=1716 RepID=UPI002649AF04|nr:OsmC family peroxiredoxin [Corynebacterium sp.]MDN5721887.1 OsmC family peroxiredoxin [Corynebacterium sp.]MDN6282123.1 OsmC family peroxiredoxin [Corynebacterium sp.]MDN6304431.1 OsmC family peroxiredoxin [Corynebacterium sp.]MDN6353958.1 OsmC family peroxiredoxin [Corynebacterium sp.]MDN6366519.1 OsmC family peroxiredoxin [Corynebacterium sp.]
MPKPSVSEASAHWEGSLFEGSGSATLETSKVATFDTSWKARTEAGAGTTNPEELLGAALASCYTMQLSNGLAEDGHPATTLDARAAVTFDPSKGGITGITLTISGDVPGMSAEDFREKARWAKENCPVSTALKSVPKELRFE